MEREFDPFLARMRAREQAREREERARLSAASAAAAAGAILSGGGGSGGSSRISWGEAALTAGIKDEKVKAAINALRSGFSSVQMILYLSLRTTPCITVDLTKNKLYIFVSQTYKTDKRDLKNCDLNIESIE